LHILLTPNKIRELERQPGEVSTLADAGVTPGNILHFIDTHHTIHTIRIKDHGMSAMRGEFFLVTTILDEAQDNGTADKVVSLGEMEEWVECRVNNIF